MFWFICVLAVALGGQKRVTGSCHMWELGLELLSGRTVCGLTGELSLQSRVILQDMPLFLSGIVISHNLHSGLLLLALHL